MRTSESPALSLMASNCSLEMHSWTFPSPWMPLAAALHLMARLSGRAGPASSAPRAKMIRASRRNDEAGWDLPREVGGSSLVATRCILALAPVRTRRNARCDAIERGIRGVGDFEGTHRPEGRATREGAKLGVSSESRVAAMFAFVPCAGAGGKPSVRKV